MHRLKQQLEQRLCVDLVQPRLRVTRLEPIVHGHSGFTFSVRLSYDGTDETLVLRVAPPGTRPRGPADILRQGRIMSALHACGAPVPAVRWSTAGLDADGSRPAILTREVAGSRIEALVDAIPAVEIAEAAVSAALALHSVPLAQTGLAGEPAVDVAGELDRWKRLMARAAPELTTDAPRLERALRMQQPEERKPTLVHGDYHYGNLLFHDGQVCAILDWEIAEVGQPLLDVASLAVMSQRAIFGAGPNPGGTVNVGSGEIARLYGCSEEELRWYIALSAYKYAAILGYNLMLHRKGKRRDEMYNELTRPIVQLVAFGLASIG